MPDKPSSKKRNIVLLTIFGVGVLLFGGLVIALPIYVQGGIAHMDCGNDCISSVRSFSYYHWRAFLALAGSAILGFLPLVIVLISARKRNDDG